LRSPPPPAAAHERCDALFAQYPNATAEDLAEAAVGGPLLTRKPLAEEEEDEAESKR
jgi:hypothetical protein